jgi:hypothetical protein
VPDWIVVDVNEASSADSALQRVAEKTMENLRPPPNPEAVERYALDLVWGDVHFVTLIRGKALEPFRRTLNIATLPQQGEELPAWRLLPLASDDAVWQQLGIATHPSSLALSARQLRAEVALAVVGLNALLHLEDAPEPDRTGVPVQEQHWRAAVAEVIAHFIRSSGITAGLPARLFDDGADSIQNLQTFLTTLAEMTAAAVPRDFVALKVVGANARRQLVGAVDAILVKSVDDELPTDHG